MPATQESSTSTAAATPSPELLEHLFNDFRGGYITLLTRKVQLMSAAKGRARAAAVGACIEAVVSIPSVPLYLLFDFLPARHLLATRS
jgi:hypothetical protein